MNQSQPENENALNVLYVDDKQDFAEVVSLRLEQLDECFEVLIEERAEAGLERLENEQIDCIVSDYQMPGMDGLEFLAKVRTEYPAIPFILFTGKGSEEIAAEAINSGVDAYVQKKTGNGQITVLSQHITTLVDKHRTEQQLTRLRHQVDIRKSRDDTVTKAQKQHSTPLRDRTASVSIGVVEAVAEREDTDPTSLSPPLYEVIDPEALDSLIDPREKPATAIDSVAFTYCGYSITVTGGGEITLESSSQ